MRRLIAVALGGLVLLGAVVYLFFPAAIVHAIALLQRRGAGFSHHEIATPFGTVPYLDGGTGPVIVLLHGFQDQKDTWVGVAEHFTDRYRVILPDLHGFGENYASTNGDYRPPAQAQRVRGFLLALGIPAAHIAGVSMGAEIAGAYAEQYPGGTLSLGLFSAAGVRPDAPTQLGRRVLAGENVFHVTSSATLDTLIALIGDSGMTLPAVLKRTMLAEYRRRNREWDTVFRQLTDSATLYLLDSIAPQIRAPSLVLWGERDSLFPVSGGRRLAARLRRSEFSVIPGCGHVCVYTRAPEVARRYRAFLSQMGGPVH